MQFREVIYPPGATTRDWVFDGALAATLTLAQAASYLVLGQAYYPQTAWEQVMCLALPAALVFRRHAPLLMLGLVTVFGVANLSTMNRPTFALVAVPIVAYAVARWVPGLIARTVLLIGAAASVLGPYRWFLGPGAYLPDGQREGMLFFTFAGLCFGAVATPYIIGRRVQDGADARERELEAERELYARAAVEREQQARLAEASTRAQIARELHDVVAHSLSIMIVQAEGGRASARKNPDAAGHALDVIAEVGRESLVEMRRIVGVLRGGTPGADLAPAPTVAGLPELVRRTSERAELHTSGLPVGLSPALELTIYRIVQEGLTNVLKHAGPEAHARVTVDAGPALVRVEIVDDGSGVHATEAGGGNGLRGMRERVESMGGVLLVGPRHDAPGFRVLAELPLHPAEGAPNLPITADAPRQPRGTAGTASDETPSQPQHPRITQEPR